MAYTIVAVYIFPEIKERGMETVMEKLEASGNSDEQIEEALEMSEKFFVPMMIAGVVFGYMIVGAILSLIAAAIAPKKGETPFRPENPS
ncbi:MAG: DUF4199 domain-containing protein [Chitinophagaceae bacterium]|nr:MAG: DUF4199 domain-containing protein [Chitinophagaceae bacterium]